MPPPSLTVSSPGASPGRRYSNTFGGKKTELGHSAKSVWTKGKKGLTLRERGNLLGVLTGIGTRKTGGRVKQT